MSEFASTTLMSHWTEPQKLETYKAILKYMWGWLDLLGDWSAYSKSTTNPCSLNKKMSDSFHIPTSLIKTCALQQ